MDILPRLENNKTLDIVELTPLTYPQYFFTTLQGTIYATRQIENKIICVLEPFMGASFKIAICDLKTKNVRLTKSSYKSMPSLESAFANFEESTLLNN